jgi:hypothetical protein
MIYRIVWLREAIDDITQIWTAANYLEQFDVRAAIEDLRIALQDEPTVVGESRFEARRIVFRWPLHATYDVDTDRGIVWVLNVGRFRRENN